MLREPTRSFLGWALLLCSLRFTSAAGVSSSRPLLRDALGPSERPATALPGGTLGGVPSPSNPSDPPATPQRCAFSNLFGVGEPPSYVAYALAVNESITVDGRLDEPAWAAVAWTSANVDICGQEAHATSCSCGVPRFTTRQKVRWDDGFLYVAAYLEETQVWANNTEHDTVMFTDDDFEVFISPDGTNHFYKEFEMNARGATWDLVLNKPYSDGGYENSTRTFGPTGWDEPGIIAAAHVHGCVLNRPSSGPCKGWSVEVAFPHAGMTLNNTRHGPPRDGEYWRINFSRVEWKVYVEGDGYRKTQPGVQQPDNWVWAPTGVVDIHQPERWGYVQFSSGSVGSATFVPDPDFAVRAAAMQLYYAQQAYRSGTGKYTTDLVVLARLAPAGAWVFDGKCTGPPEVTLTHVGYVGTIAALGGSGRVALITHERYLRVEARNAAAVVASPGSHTSRPTAQS